MKLKRIIPLNELRQYSPGIWLISESPAQGLKGKSCPSACMSFPYLAILFIILPGFLGGRMGQSSGSLISPFVLVAFAE
jgi:hypothetical protein